MKKNSIKYIMGLMVLVSSFTLAMDHDDFPQTVIPTIKLPGKFGIGLDKNTLQAISGVESTLQQAGNSLANAGNSIAEATGSLQNTAAQTVSAANQALTRQVASVGTIANQFSSNIDGSLNRFSTTITHSLPHLIKTAALNCAGLMCCGGGAWMFVKGIQQACTAQAVQDQGQENKTFFGRCAKILSHPITKGIIQSGAGLATFAAGIMTIVKSEKIVTYFNR